MMVKICGITNREDAIAAVEAGASALGFNFYAASPRYVAPEAAAEIGAGINVTKVGIFVNEAPEFVAAAMQTAALQVAQVYGERRYEGVRTWRACPVRSDDFALPDDHDAEAFLLDAFSAEAPGGTGKTFPWIVARDLTARIVLAGGLDGGNVREAIEAAKPWGVDACSRIERTPGRKDHNKMKRFVEAALASTL